MSFDVPSLQQVLERARGRLREELPGTDASIWPNTNYVTTKVWAGEVWELYQFLLWIKKQRFATTADGDQLDEHGAQFGITRNAATPAHGDVQITGTAGTIIAEGTEYARSDGRRYATTAGVTIPLGGTATVEVEAVEAGQDGNTVGGAELVEVVSTGLVTRVYVPEGLGAGADIEGDESLRARVLFRMRYPPRGGAPHDYVFWALSISGVTRVWVDPLPYGPGTVGVWFMTDNVSANYGVPSEQFVEDVSDYIATVRPTGARVIVQAPTPAVIDVTALVPGGTQAMKDAIDAELKDVFRRAVQVSMPNAPFVLKQNVIWQAVARVVRSVDFELQLPAGDIAIPVGSIPVLGATCINTI